MIEDTPEGARVRLRVQPKASRNAVTLEQDGRIRLALTAPPVEGAANKAACDFVAIVCGVPRSRVKLASGEKSREKALLIKGLSADAVREAFARARS